jgi:hypothetical protein
MKFIFILWIMLFPWLFACESIEKEQSNEKSFKITIKDSIVLKDVQALAQQLPTEVLLNGYPFFTDEAIYYQYFLYGNVLKFDYEGKLLKTFGSVGDETQHLTGSGLMIDESVNNLLHFYDPMRQKVVSYNAEGIYEASHYFMKDADKKDFFMHYQNLSTISNGFYIDGKYYVASTGGEKVKERYRKGYFQSPLIQVFDKNFEWKTAFGNYDEAYLADSEGTLSYLYITQLAYNGKNLLLSMQGSTDIQVYDIGSKKLVQTISLPKNIQKQLKTNYPYLNQLPADKKLNELYTQHTIFNNLVADKSGKLIVRSLVQPTQNPDLPFKQREFQWIAYDGKGNCLGIFDMPPNCSVVCHIDKAYIYFLGFYDEENAQKIIYRYAY